MEKLKQRRSGKQIILRKNKKCLVLDLDNTLWGGVIGDVGKEGIDLGRDTSIGQAYLDFHLAHNET